MSRLMTYGTLALGALLGCSAADGSGRRPERTGDRTAAQLAQGSACRESGASRALPAEIRETSGLAQSRRDTTMFWTHNDSGNPPDIFAVSAEGRIMGRSRVVGASLLDWEDIVAGPCTGGNCLYIADIGDNARRREHVSIYMVPEPAARATATAPANRLKVRFPDGPQDAEAMFVLPSGDLFLVTKGRHAAIALYRAPTSRDTTGVHTLERVRELWPQPANERDRVTAASATQDGRWIAIRTYRTLYLYPSAPFVAGQPVTPTTVDLSPFREFQGEAIALTDAGTVWLTSEAEKKRDLPRMTRLECTLPVTRAGPGA